LRKELDLKNASNFGIWIRDQDQSQDRIFMDFEYVLQELTNKHGEEKKKE